MKIYLSQLQFDPQKPGVVQFCSDPYKIHAHVLAAFGGRVGGGALDHRVLWRLDGDVLLVQSPVSPKKWKDELVQGFLLKPPETREVSIRFQAGQLYYFRIRVNPVIAPTRPPDKKPANKKVGNKVTPIKEVVERKEWLTMLLENTGYAIQYVEEKDTAVWHFEKPDGHHKITLFTGLYNGILAITDPERAARRLIFGYGRARAFGQGLLSLAPVPPG